jgi:hypothetical protein
VPIVVGGLLEWFGRRRDAGEESRASPPSQPSQKGILFSSGVVAGEALVGVGVAMLIGLDIKGPALAFEWRDGLSLAAAISIVGVFAAATRTSRGSNA